MLLGSLSHDAGQPALLLSYSSATAGFQEAHWALPVEYGTEICSYQRLSSSIVSGLPPYNGGSALQLCLFRHLEVDSRAALIHAVRAREHAR